MGGAKVLLITACSKLLFGYCPAADLCQTRDLSNVGIAPVSHAICDNLPKTPFFNLNTIK